MLDMAFQLLAFFLLVYRPGSSETRIDLVLPAEPVALPGAAATEPGGAAPTRAITRVPSQLASERDPYADIEVEAIADDAGLLQMITLAGAHLASPDALTQRLRRYRRLLSGQILRVRLVADDRLFYAEAARLIAAIHNAGVASIRLAGRIDSTAPSERVP
jgi:biopolymer transport protein ExbD